MHQKPYLVLSLGIGLMMWMVFTAEVKSQHATPSVSPERGDRIVFLGDGFMEGALPYGYLESAIISYWPDQRLSFRNIGWSGDTPRGTSRDHFTNPPTPYQHLFEQISFADPDLTVICYGRYLAFEPADSIETFISDMGRLIDSLSVHHSRVVLVTPPPIIEEVSPHPEATQQNRRLMQVNNAIAALAQERALPLVDLYSGIQALPARDRENISEDGIYLNESGYYHAARIFQQELGWVPQNEQIVIHMRAEEEAGRSDEDVLRIGNNPVPVELSISRLPLVAPEGMPPEVNLVIEGLPEGRFQLEIGSQTIAGTSQEWSAGLLVSLSPLVSQFHALRQEVRKKNELFFQQYRPQNETYLVGFREYEQGQNAKDLELLEPFIQTRENEIRRNSIPQVIRGQLRAIGE